MEKSKEIMSRTANIIKSISNQPYILSGLRAASRIDDPRAQRVWPYLFESSKENSTCVTDEEKIIYMILRLYAIHQQGKNDQVCEFNRNEGRTFIDELIRLRRLLDDVNGLDRRVNNLLATNNINYFYKQLVSLIKIMKSKNDDFKIDYVNLAKDMYYLQYYSSSKKIRLAWGKKYYKNIKY
ncbi:type I-E CRISPR-associated protein Cse2/CasB [Ligilactobacillus salivarius]|uniref:type I-E CRISPR-associated protein Cse2/CasB n=1 Tax=Ligilactobacillus salivarius TaxID=1624 RepID=UPI003977DEFB